jgi:predicted RNA binding protein YcfA (HicA-like mRNA interferase family)
MTRLPVVSGRQCMRALERVGFRIVRDESSHVVMKRQYPPARVSIPDHKTLAPGTLRAIIREAGLSVADFVDLLS